jgi:hypothetical protein
MEKLQCPFCKGDLKVTHQEHYQDSCEHVSQPNAKPSLKDGYECLNVACLAFGNFSWIADGDYYSKKPEGFTYSEWSALKKDVAKSENFHAIGSWNYYYQQGKDAIKARTKEYKFWKYRVVVEPREKGHDYPLAEQYQPKRFGWKFEWWKRGSEPGCWQHLTPTHRMVSYYIRSFKSSYDSAIYNPKANRSQIKSALEYAMGYRWGTKDDRSFAQIAGFIIRTFMPSKVKDLKELAIWENVKL